MPAFSQNHLSQVLLCLLMTAALASCTTASAPTPPTPVEPAEKGPSASARGVPEFIPVVRYGRYTLVELAPISAQQDLLLQVVDVTVPGTRTATVGDALRHVLLRSGYQLCSSSDIAALNALPLPASHYRLGPLLLRDALLTLAGPAWDLEVDDGARRICFTRAAQPNTGGALPQSGPNAPVDIARPPLKTEARP